MSIEGKPQSYTTFEKRLLSFYRWAGIKTPKSLARAGFYYTQCGDTVSCFSCGVLIGQWEHQDDPLKEHLRWSKSCVYATLLSDDPVTEFDTVC